MNAVFLLSFSIYLVLAVMTLVQESRKRKGKRAKKRPGRNIKETQHVCDHPSAHPKQINRQFVVTRFIDWLNSLSFPYLTTCLCWI